MALSMLMLARLVSLPIRSLAFEVQTDNLYQDQILKPAEMKGIPY